MKRTLFSLTIFFFLAQALVAKNDTTTDRIKVEGPTMKIIGLDTVEIVRVPPPAQFLNKADGSRSGLNVKVNYKGFSSQARRAFQYAVDIWSSLISSPREIVIDAQWTKLADGVLGSCGPTNYYRNYDGMPDNDIFYPIVLAEKMYNEELNDEGEGDIIAFFNSDAEWYYGRDGETPDDKYDLVSVVLHELCHGFGFTGSFSVEGSRGSWGWGMNSPFAFDQFITDSKGNFLIDTTGYPNNSKELKEALTSGILYFDAPVLNSENGSNIYLYAPSTWNEGSSIYHVHNFYLNTENAMMCYNIGKGKSVHDPGFALNMLEDMGWKHMHIRHKAKKNTENIADVEIVAEIFPDFESDVLSPRLFYSIDSTDYNEVDMLVKSAAENLYKAVIPVSGPGDISYYITATDGYGRDFKTPVHAPETNYHFYMGADTIAPEIKHYFSKFLNPGQDSIPVKAYITDAFGVDTVWVEYAVNGEEQLPVGLVPLKNDKYELMLDISSFGLDVGDSVTYRLLAQDVSKAKNIAVSPDSGNITVNVEAIPDFVSSFSNDFELGNSDFILQGFEISVPSGFDNGALHTVHPYEFAGEANSLEYIAQLRYPVKIDEIYHYIEFDEIVLVEPGEPGYEFGEDEFWDYVIVEASKTEGATWTPIEPGWDSRLNKEWETVYNQSIWEQHSQAVGTPEMYKSHQINILNGNKLSVGDEILLRFRLYSDPYAYGWGWAIDNLKIQTEGLSAVLYAKTDGVKVYPNPVKGNLLFINPNGQEIQEVSLYNFSGSRVVTYENINSTSEVKIDLPGYLHGVCFAVIKTDHSIERIKFLVK
jgi:hypothetical protein